jgi:pimeloyl-ACP methyl ester carboxylesterase
MQLAHDRAGSGPPLVLIHGIGSRRQIWDPVTPALAAERDVLAIDLPGFAASPPLPAGARVDVPLLTAHVLAFAGDLGLRDWHVAGNSLGGAIALELAARGAVRSATAFSPAGFWTERERAWCQRSLASSKWLVRALRPALPALVGTAVGRTPLFAQTFGKPWQMTSRECLGTVDALLAASAFDEALANFTGYRAPTDHGDVPVTIAWGTRDRLLLPREGRRAQRLMPRARHVELRGCGHVPFGDDPELLARVLLEGSQVPA